VTITEFHSSADGQTLMHEINGGHNLVCIDAQDKTGRLIEEVGVRWDVEEVSWGSGMR
jgi:hypothetical protein